MLAIRDTEQHDQDRERKQKYPEQESTHASRPQDSPTA